MLRLSVLAALLAAQAAFSGMVPSSCAQDGSCTAKLQAALTGCFGSSAPCTVDLEPGATYPLDGPEMRSCIVSAAQSSSNPVPPPSFTFNGNGAELVLHPLSGFICLGGLSNVLVRNFTLDMVRQPYSLGRVVSSSASESVLIVDSDAYPHATPSGSSWTNVVQAILQYDPAADRPAAKGTDIYALKPNALSAAWAPGPNASAASLTVSHGHLPVGSWQIMRHQVYSLNGLTLGGVRSVTIEDVTIYSVPGMGIVSDQSSDITLRRVQVRKRAGRPMSITADAVHLTSCRGGDVHIDQCLFEGQGDDGGNIPSRYWEARGISPDRKTLTLWQRGAQVPFQGQPGDELLFYGRTSFGAYGRGGGVRVASIDAAAGTLTMTAPLPAGGAVWDLVLNLANQPRSITVRDTVYRANRARGLLLKASDVAVVNCTFDHNTGPAIRVVPDGAMWFEGDVVSRGNWTLRDSRIVGVNYATAANPGDVTFGAEGPVFKDGVPTKAGAQVARGTQHFNVTVENNTFEQDVGQAAVSAFGIEGLRATGNTVTSTTGRPAANFLLSSSCSKSTVSDNVCSPGPCTTAGA